MVEHSGLSGDPLEGDGPIEVTVQLTDGARRRVRVSAAEHERLSAGALVTHPWNRLSRWLRHNALKIVGVVVAAAVGTAIAQSTANHYAKRQQELDLKATLITTISRASVSTYYSAFDVVNVGVERHWRGLSAIRERNRVTTAWSATAAEVDPLLFLHFDGSEAERHWYRFQNALYDFAALSYVDVGEQRAGLVDTAGEYLRDYPLDDPLPRPEPDADPLKLLACRSLHCSETSRWRAQYRWLGLTLLRERGVLARTLLATDAERLG